MDDEVTMLQAFKALAHPVRLGMLRRLAAAGEICACDFTDDFDISQPTVSAHLRTLREAGLVTTRRDGTTICYSLVPEALSELGDQLARIGDTAATVA
ncbi:ArsR/SmtB family transcription factor [Stackebrandtia nassauensis]|uniref:Transcriptional regulator, ArsR family n=1 Tax=Stackebrandtia nassauensis (strain DSM 44728 / CIP 108903 / NRRL B-16338 / NBRC 102104 / LLR-40K-21) TaxID=446470 RepID=D3QBY4_STANL|nr:metalloregulator ArsR/SmtB family transcription factor [Stackebrandtia nassauensis]ADD44873.1 transcriptional regulator, ArsR family [Stackebrandtia nassauensis DSM 44728]